MPIVDSLNAVLNQLPETCTLVAVSKTKPIEDILEAYSTGQRHFGENKVQDVNWKYEALPKDIHWHFIGHLQSNKVKFIAPFVHLIHAVDSIKLLNEIDKRARQNDRIIDCLLQLSIADEETKFGFEEEVLKELLSNDSLGLYKNVNVRGLMGMATNTSDEAKVRAEFRHLNSFFKNTSATLEKTDFNILSMGMTNDYKIAMEEGSTMIRIGSLIFGAR